MGSLLLKLPLTAILGGSAAAGVLSLALALGAVDKYGKDLPDHRILSSYVPASGSEVVAADGSPISKRASKRRTFVPIGSIPPLVRRAFLSAEDKNYATHAGIDPVAMARAAVSSLKGGVQSGASTITQQVAKNLLVGNERSASRKVREAILALRMDRDVGKERILEIYLNEIYLGGGAYGVSEAARTFFGKTLEELDLPEAALIAAMPKAPSAFDPVRNPARAKARRDYVIRRMVEDGVVGEREGADAVASGLGVLADRGTVVASSSSVEAPGWFEGDAWNSIDGFVRSSGLADRDLVVRTTLDPKMQASAAAALREGVEEADRSLGWHGPVVHVPSLSWDDVELPEGADPDETCLVVGSTRSSAACRTKDGRSVVLGPESIAWTGRDRPSSFLEKGDVVLFSEDDEGNARLRQMPEVEGALVAIDPRNGDVKALVGGWSHDRSVFDRVTQARRQPGSAYKPVVYLAAMEAGYDARSPLLDAPIVIEQGPGQEDWRPNDARTAGRGGLIPLRRSLEKSRNMASVRLLWDMGLDDVADMAARLGVLPANGMSYAAGLGSGEVSPMQMALAYSTIANGGFSIRPRYVTVIEDPDGKAVAAVPEGRGGRSVDAVATAQMMSVLRGVVTDGTAKPAFEGFGRWFAGKTGTTNSARDVWFVGASPRLVVAVWIGRDDNRPLSKSASGGKVAGTVTRRFLDMAGDSADLVEPELPPGAEFVPVDPATGLESSSGNAVGEIVRSARSVVIGETSE